MNRVRVKICGITTVTDACLAAQLGADALGLNFFEGSPRYLTPSAAESILRALPPFVEPVALFVNRPFPAVVQVLKDLGRIRTFQWHGVNLAWEDVFPFQVIPAFPIRDRESLEPISRFLEAARARDLNPPAILVDAHVPGKHGGTGQCAPWSLLADFRPPVPLILAGGLTADNVAEAIRLVRPYAVDVASGVESRPGLKDPEKMRRFIARVRETVEGLHQE
jgi:phosphoribosylanthranilate isomerase